MFYWMSACVVGALVFGCFAAWVAKQKQRATTEGFALGMTFGPLGVLVEALLPQGNAANMSSAQAGTHAQGPTEQESGKRAVGLSWLSAGIPLAVLAGLLWAMGIIACGRILDDFGGVVPPLTSGLITYAWPLALAFVVLTSGCLLGLAASTRKVTLLLRTAGVLIVGLYMGLALVGCGAPLLRLVQHLN